MTVSRQSRATAHGEAATAVRRYQEASIRQAAQLLTCALYYLVDQVHYTPQAATKKLDDILYII